MNHVKKISWFFLLACICSINICHDLLPILCWHLIFCMSFRIERLHYLLVTTAADSQFCKELPNSSFLFAGSSCLEMRTCLLRILPPCVEIGSFQIVLVSLWTCRKLLIRIVSFMLIVKSHSCASFCIFADGNRRKMFRARSDTYAHESRKRSLHFFFSMYWQRSYRQIVQTLGNSAIVIVLRFQKY